MEQARKDAVALDLTGILTPLISALETPEITHHKWLDLANDTNFGDELIYIRRRAFRRPPFTHSTNNGSLMGQGYYNVIMSDSFMRLSAKITKMNSEVMLSKAVAIDSNLLYEWKKIIPGIGIMGCILREFWSINEAGVTSLPLRTLGWSRIDTQLTDGETLQQYCHSNNNHHCLSGTIVIATANLNQISNITTLNLTIVKPNN